MHNQDVNQVIKWGMHYIGKSLGYIIRGDFEGLREKVQKKLAAHFNLSLDDTLWNSILVGAAEELNDSIRVWRKEYAAAIFRYEGRNDLAEKTEEELRLYKSEISRTFITGGEDFLY
jgi:hypothetical protein